VHRVGLLVVLALMGCALMGCAGPVRAPAPLIAEGFRATAAPLYSTAGLPAARLLGDWRQVAGFGAAQRCAPAPSLQVQANAAGQINASYDLCLGAQRVQGAGALASAGAQGRYAIAGLPAPIWVLWIDESNRSMVLGTPSGSFGAVLSKGAIWPDHLRAAREILAWNGYDLTRFYQY
jgi:apolipoprotein D and lipocalin family protein